MKGFTFAEMLLSLLALALLTLLILPRVVRARELAQINTLVSHAQTIHNTLFGLDLGSLRDYLLREHFRKASSHDFATSTAMFREMVSTGCLNTTYAFFSGMGVPPCTSTNPADFTAANNAWCVVADMETISDEMTPILFTRNVSLARIGPDERPTLTRDSPMGTKRWVFAMRSGAVFAADADSIGYWYTGRETNKVLRP